MDAQRDAFDSLHLAGMLEMEIIRCILAPLKDTRDRLAN